MSDMLKVEGFDDLLKDPTTGVIINQNRAAYEQYVAKRRKEEAVTKQVERNAADILELKNDLSEIKNLLTQILNK